MRYSVGDKVEVVNKWKCYSSYEGFINKYGNKYKKYWKNGCSIFDDKAEYKILLKGKHICGAICYLIQNTRNKQVFIIGENGIKPIVEDIIEYKGKKYDVVEDPRSNCDDILFIKEHKEEILDEVEKRYLSTVIKPFKERIKFIIKIRRGINEEKLCYQDERDFHSFPYFKANTMYKGMELNKEYTLEELGLK